MILFKGIYYEVPVTDLQRSRVYRSEWAVRPLAPVEVFKTRRGMEGRARRILQSSTVTKLRGEFGLGPMKGVRVNLKRGRRSWAYENHLEMAKNAGIHSLLHELAHVIVPWSVHHQWPFCYALLKLTSRFIGRDYSQRLKQAFKENRVKFRAPRKRSVQPTPVQTYEEGPQELKNMLTFS